MREIVAITTQTRRYHLGDLYSTQRLTDTTMPGQCANVPWVRVHRYNGSFVDCNAALLESIEYSSTDHDEPRRIPVVLTLDALVEQMTAEKYPDDAIEKIREAQDIIDPNQVGGA